MYWFIKKIMDKNTQNFFYSLKPSETVVFSDMSGTLIFQTEDGFMDEQKEEVIKFLDNNGKLIIVTGDIPPVVDEHFFRKLNYSGDNEIYLLAASGHYLARYVNGDLEILRTKQGLSDDLKRNFLDRIVYLLEDIYKAEIKISKEKLLRFFSEFGDRIDISNEIGIEKGSFMLEVSPSSITVADVTRKIHNSEFNQLLERLNNDRVIQGLLQKTQYHPISDFYYYTFVSTYKDEGIYSFINSKDSESLGILNKNIIVFGDSPNDEGLFKYPYQTNQKLIKVYVGDDDDFYQKFPAKNSDISLHLDSQFTKGTLEILKLVNV